MLRAYLKKQKGVVEDLYFFGPKTGWAYRYVRDAQQSVGSILIHDEQLLGVVALDPAATAAVDWNALSPIGQKAKRLAHGSPALLWIDLPLDGTGASDFKAVVKAKLGAMHAFHRPHPHRRRRRPRVNETQPPGAAPSDVELDGGCAPAWIQSRTMAVMQSGKGCDMKNSSSGICAPAQGWLTVSF